MIFNFTVIDFLVLILAMALASPYLNDKRKGIGWLIAGIILFLAWYIGAGLFLK